MLSLAMLLGYATRDAELSQRKDGLSMVRTALALNEVYRDRQGARQERTTFVPIVAFARTARSLARVVKKGTLLYVVGNVWRKQVVRPDGERRVYQNVVVQMFRVVKYPGARNSPKNDLNHPSTPSSTEEGRRDTPAAPVRAAKVPGKRVPEARDTPPGSSTVAVRYRPRRAPRAFTELADELEVEQMPAAPKRK